MELIRGIMSVQAAPAERVIEVSADRRTLAKTRWRGVADDGMEFGFDLASPLAHGAVVFQKDGTRYVLEQQPETLLRLHFHTPADAARLGWMIGNLHFPAQVSGDTLLVEADPAIRQMLTREHIEFEEIEAVFQPLKAAGAHSHHDHAHH